MLARLTLLLAALALLSAEWTAEATLPLSPSDVQAAQRRGLNATNSANSSTSSPTPAPTQTSTPIPTAVEDSSTFALVDSYTCNATIVKLVGDVCSANRAMLDVCEAESGSQPFLNSGEIPRGKVVSRLVASTACMDLTTAVALLELPACLLGQVPLRALCETLLVFWMDEANGQSDDFQELLVWRQDSNLAKEAGKPYDAQSETYAAFSSSLRQALSQSNVSVRANDSIVMESIQAEAIEMSDGAQATFTDTRDRASDYHDVVASVHASVASSRTTGESQEMTTFSSNTLRPTTEPIVVVTAFTVAFVGLLP